MTDTDVVVADRADHEGMRVPNSAKYESEQIDDGLVCPVQVVDDKD
ncbi:MULTISPECIES: hypothetical protein [Mycolicibacterium]